jgi:hypothetical protein
MNSTVVKNIAIAEKELNTPLPPRLREFISNLYDHEMEIGDDTWFFTIVNDEVLAAKDNPIVSMSNSFREQWKIPAIIFAYCGIGDYLAVWPGAGNEQTCERIFLLTTGSYKLEYYAPDIFSAYSGHFSPPDLESFNSYSLAENGEITVDSGFGISGNYQSSTTSAESGSEPYYIDEYDRKKSIVYDMIDNEETDKYEEILDILHELTRQPDYAPRAWYKLAELYFKGFGPLAQNMELALEYNGKAVDLGHAKSMANRAWCYFSGFGLEKNIEKAYELIKAANDSTLQGAKEKDGLYYEMLLQIKSEYLKQKKKK